MPPPRVSDAPCGGVCSERDMAKLMALESERKLRAALMQIVRMRDQHKEFRWIRLTQKLLLRNEKKSGWKKLRCVFTVTPLNIPRGRLQCQCHPEG